VDSSPLATFALDAHGLVTYWNAAAERLIGWTRNELLGHELPFDLNGPIQGKNGSFIEAAIWMAPIRSPYSQPRGTLIIAAGNVALHDAGLELSASIKPRLAVHG
jgi:PAS domain-containing protein